MELKTLTIADVRQGLLEKRFSAAELAEEFLGWAEVHDRDIGAFLSLDREGALAHAKAVDEMIATGAPLPPLAGAPVALKDNLMVEGKKTTAASKILENYVASYDATIVVKLKEAGAVIIGKTNLDEFAMGSSTENSAFQVTRNPYDASRVAGGSSGGSAAAVAAGMALAALGSDTGGSIRQPAAFCGVVGLKPTYGVVSRSGLIAMASSLDQIGPLARTVADVRAVFEAIRGADPLDATSANFQFFPLRGISRSETIFNDRLQDVKKLRIGIPKEYFTNGLDAAVARGMEDAIGKFKKSGFTVREISLPHTKYALSVYYIIMPAEVSANLARFDGIRYSRTYAECTRTDAEGQRRSALAPLDAKLSNGVNQRRSALEEIYFRQRGEGFGVEARRRILLGTFVLSAGYYDAYYAKAQKVRALIARDFDEAFKEVDVILTPVTPTPAFEIGEKTNDPLTMYLSDVFTIPANLAGLPAISIPVDGYRPERKELPVGFQLMGKRFHDDEVLAMGEFYERE